MLALKIAPGSLLLQVPSREIDKAEGKFWTHWNRETKQVPEHGDVSAGLEREQGQSAGAGPGRTLRSWLLQVAQCLEPVSEELEY